MSLFNYKDLSIEQQSFFNDVSSILDNKNEITMSFGDVEFVVDPHGQGIEVYSKGKTIAIYSDVVDFLFNHRIKDKTIIELSSEIDYSI